MDDEFELGKIVLDLWEGKWRIVISVVIAFIISLGYIFFLPQPNYQATTDLKPLNSVQAKEYSLLNSLTSNNNLLNSLTSNNNLLNSLTSNNNLLNSLTSNNNLLNSLTSDNNLLNSLTSDNNLLNSFEFFQITPQTLLNLYIEQVEFKSLFIDIIKNLEIYKRSDYATEEDYENAIINLASRIEILSPNDNEEGNKNNKDLRKYHQIIFSHTDEELWKNILTEFDKISQEFIRNELIERFNQKVSIEKTKIKYQLDDIETQIRAQTLIYNLQIQNRLAYLEEQAQLARTLGIKSDTLETQNFDSKNFSITNIDTKAPFYLRGYESIEKEIALINSRKDEKKYINALIELENKKYLLNEDKNLERIEELFLNTPITQKENFVAANLNIEGTEFEYESNRRIILMLGVFLGLFVGSIYVLLSNSLRNRKQTPVS